MKLLKKKDLLLAVPLLLLAAALLLFRTGSSGSCVAIVEKDGSELSRIDLSTVTESRQMELSDDYHIVLLIEPGAISFLHSDCPDQICVRTGRLTKTGETAVCLPARVSVRLEGKSKTYDGVTG